MSYKTVLVHVDQSKNVSARIEMAAGIAISENAHLIGAAMTGISRFLFETVTINPQEASITPYLDTLRQRANQNLEKFDQVMQQAGVLSFEKRLVDDEAAGGISLQARYCDLVVIGQYDPDEISPYLQSDFPEYVALNSGCPVLIVPYAGIFRNVGSRVLIAWNGSKESRRAVQSALPMLKRAKVVEVAVFNPSAQADRHGEQPGADIALYLARHGVTVNVREEVVVESNVGNALLSLAADLSSDLIVMGCYGHSRFREVVLGGVTRTLLESMTVPVMMSH